MKNIKTVGQLQLFFGGINPPKLNPQKPENVYAILGCSNLKIVRITPEDIRPIISSQVGGAPCNSCNGCINPKIQEAFEELLTRRGGE